jgi:signal transduction histidine kinase
LAGEYVFVPLLWRRSSAITRVLFAVGMVALAGVHDSPLLAKIAASLYLIFSAAVLLMRFLQRPAGTMAALIVDTMAYLLSVTLIANGSLWIILHQFCFLALTVLLLHHWQQLLAVFGTCIAYFLLVGPPAWREALPGLVVTSLVAAFALWQKQVIEDRLFQMSRQAVMYRSSAENVRFQERARIADDFHDGPLQMFMSLTVRLEVLRRMLEKKPESAMSELEQLQDVWKKQVTEAREFIHTIRAATTIEENLASALERLVDLFEKDNGIATSLRVLGNISTVESVLTSEVLQMAREALHNTWKHAKATEIHVTLEQGDHELLLTVEDNGQGFPFSGSYTLEELDLLRLGPVSIKRRVNALQGGLILESRPGKGSTVRIRIPQ